MSQELTIAIFAGLGGMIGWGLADFFAKSTIDQIGDVPTLYWGQLLGILPLLLLAIAKQTTFEYSRKDAVILPLMGIWSGLSYIPTYVAFGKGRVSLLSPIFASYAVLVTLLSALIFGEVLPAPRAAAMALVFVGILIITGNPAELWATTRDQLKLGVASASGIPEIMAAVALYSVWLIALDQVLNDRDWIPVLLVIRVCSALSIALYARFTRRDTRLPRSGLLRPLILIGALDVAAFAFVAYGFSASSYVSVVAMLSSAFSLPTMLLAKAILKEQSTPSEFAGSLLIVIGIVLIPLV